MNDDAREAEGLGALELVREGIHGLPPLAGIEGRQVDQIARVRKHVADRRRAPGDGEVADLVGAERAGRPLALVLEKDLHGTALQRSAALQRAIEAAADRHVRADVISEGGFAPLPTAPRALRPAYACLPPGFGCAGGARARTAPRSHGR